MRAKVHFRLAWAPDSIVWHKVGGSSTKQGESVSLFSLRLLYRNRIKFVARFLPQRMAVTKRGLWRLVLFYCSRAMFREANVVLDALLHTRELIRQGQRA
jgi:GT2 family glycosyltransferase